MITVYRIDTDKQQIRYINALLTSLGNMYQGFSRKIEMGNTKISSRDMKKRTEKPKGQRREVIFSKDNNFPFYKGLALYI